jgi:hypothetical protein
LRYSEVASEPKLANEKPCSFGLTPESIATAVSLEVDADPPHEPNKPPTSTAMVAKRVAR